MSGFWESTPRKQLLRWIATKGEKLTSSEQMRIVGSGRSPLGSHLVGQLEQIQYVCLDYGGKKHAMRVFS